MHQPNTRKMNHVRFLGKSEVPDAKKASIRAKVKGSEKVLEPKVQREENKIKGKPS